MTPPGRRVLFVDHETRLSGAQLVLRDLIDGLVRRGSEVHLAVPGDGPLPRSAAAAGAHVHEYRMADALRSVSRWELARRAGPAVRLTAEIGRSCRDLHRVVGAVAPDVVHTNSLKAHLLAVPATRLRRRPQVWHVHDIVDGPPLRLLSTAGVVGAASLICVSEAVAAPLRPRLGPRIRVVHNGIEQHRADVRDAQAFREAVGVRDDQVLVTMVGQIAHWKGQDLLVEAARRLRTRADLHFAFVGECLYPENEAAYDARTRSSSSDLGSSVTWTGRVEPIGPVMAGSDVVVHASRLPEPFGRVIVEAMAQATPVITSDIGAGPELVPPDVGVVVTPDDPMALAAAVAGLADDPARRAAMAARGPGVAARYTVERMVDGVLAVHDEVTGGA